MTELGFDQPIPDAFAWSELSSKVAEASRLSSRHRKLRSDASDAFVFSKAQNKIANPPDRALDFATNLS